MAFLKSGRDTYIDGMILGAVAGILIAGSGIPAVQGFVTQIMGMIPQNWISWAGTFQKEAVFGIIGAVAGYIIDVY